jgi:hypothetical protein
MRKKKPGIDELGAHSKDVLYQGKKYELNVKEKVADDGVIETHMDYKPQWRPKGAKSRGTFNIPVCLKSCKCQQCRRKK